jgi:hypothetical protein
VASAAFKIYYTVLYCIINNYCLKHAVSCCEDIVYKIAAGYTPLLMSAVSNSEGNRGSIACLSHISSYTYPLRNKEFGDRDKKVVIQTGKFIRRLT